VYLWFVTPDILPAEIRAFFSDFLNAASSAGIDLIQGHRWFFVSQILCQLVAKEFGLSAVVLPASHQRVIDGCLAMLVGVDPDSLVIASREVAVASSEATLALYDTLSDEEDQFSD
jgi:hypothetical protein